MLKWMRFFVLLSLLALAVGWQVGVFGKIVTLAENVALLRESVIAVQKDINGVRTNVTLLQEVVDTKIPVPLVTQEECWKVDVLVPSDYGFVFVGESMLCGAGGLRNTAIYGPDLDAHLTRMEEQVGRLTEDLERWQLCAIKKICPQDLLESAIVK